ncbi:MAG: hypothetical protein AAB738_01350 [Patescibacteria group bacterium]
MNKKTIWILIIIIIVVGIILLTSSKEEPTTPTKENQPAAETPVTLKPATGNIDDAVNSILSEAGADAQAPADTNSSLTAPEDFSSLDQSLNTSNIQ